MMFLLTLFTHIQYRAVCLGRWYEYVNTTDKPEFLFEALTNKHLETINSAQIFCEQKEFKMYGCWCRTAHGILCVSRILFTWVTSEIYIFKAGLYKTKLTSTDIEYVLYSLENWGVYGNGSFCVPGIYWCNLFYVDPDTVQRGTFHCESTYRSTGRHVRININIVIVLL
jgi:hypothetical protein